MNIENAGNASYRGPSERSLQDAADRRVENEEKLQKLNERIYEIDTELGTLRSIHDGQADTMDDATLERITKLEQEKRGLLAEFEKKTTLH